MEFLSADVDVNAILSAFRIGSFRPRRSWSISVATENVVGGSDRYEGIADHTGGQSRNQLVSNVFA